MSPCLKALLRRPAGLAGLGCPLNYFFIDANPFAGFAPPCQSPDTRLRRAWARHLDDPCGVSSSHIKELR